MATVIHNIALEVVITGIAAGAAYGVVELMRWLLEIPAPTIPTLPLIALAVLTTRLVSSGWLAKLLRQSDSNP